MQGKKTTEEDYVAECPDPREEDLLPVPYQAEPGRPERVLRPLLQNLRGRPQET
jgi:hypothetical protein